MYTVALIAGKGGAGKTTTATALAVAAAAAGSRVLLLDLDPQESARRWGAARGDVAPLVTVEASDAARLGARLRSAAPSYDVTVIDTPPSAASTARAAAQAAAGGLVVIPVRPSPHDLRTVRETLDLVRGAKAPFLLAVTQGSARTRLTVETVEALAALGPLGPMLSRLDVFAASAADGLTPLDVEPRGRAASEIRTLWQQIAGRLVDKTT